MHVYKVAGLFVKHDYLLSTFSEVQLNVSLCFDFELTSDEVNNQSSVI